MKFVLSYHPFLSLLFSEKEKYVLTSLPKNTCMTVPKICHRIAVDKPGDAIQCAQTVGDYIEEHILLVDRVAGMMRTKLP